MSNSMSDQMYVLIVLATYFASSKHVYENLLKFWSMRYIDFWRLAGHGVLDRSSTGM